MKYKGIKRLIEEIEKNPNLKYIAKSRNVSELIKLIPYFGSIIESNTLGKVRDNELDKRLNEIEENLEDALTIEDGELLVDLIRNNSLLLYSFIAHFQNELFQTNLQLQDQIKNILAIPQNVDKAFSPNKKFLFVILSGASSTGKDSTLQKLLQQNYKSYISPTILKKYTTREPRNNTEGYYEFLSQKEFDKYLRKDKLIFSFPKRGFNYGFDKSNLYKQASTPTILFCIFTEFKMLEKAKVMLEELGIDTLFILMEAKYQELSERVDSRNFTRAEGRLRKNSIIRDLKYIEENNDLINDIFELRIYTGDDKSKNDVYREIHLFISNHIESKN